MRFLGDDMGDVAIDALETVCFGADKTDLNLGCPAPTVNKHKGGAVLPKRPEFIYHVVQTLYHRLSPHVPLTAKMHLGYEGKSPTLEYATAIAAVGAYTSTVHARTKNEDYEPPAH